MRKIQINIKQIIITLLIGFSLLNVYNLMNLGYDYFQHNGRTVKLHNMPTFVQMPAKDNNASMSYKMPYELTRFIKEHNRTENVLIAAVILLRIYETDKAKLTKLELKQWIQYMIYAGVGRVYLYDNYAYKNESLRKWCLDNFPNIVVYHDWNQYTPYDIIGTQVASYEHALHTYKNVSTWQIAFDMDEYPFMMNDREKDFLKRFIERKMKSHPYVNEWSLKNFLFLGKPLIEEHILKRYLRRTPNPANDKDKPIYRTQYTRECGIHHDYLLQGKSIDADPNEIRMNHYWGARLQNWGNDTKEVLEMTIPDESIVGLVDKIEKYFRDHLTIAYI